MSKGPRNGYSLTSIACTWLAPTNICRLWRRCMGRNHWIALPFVAMVAACSMDSAETSTATSAVTNENGVWQNGVFQNGVWQNGVWQNGVWQNGVWQNNLPALELLHDNPYAREVL